MSAASADAPWTIPVCVAYGGKLEGEACKLLSASESVLELPASAGCPDWAIPNIRGDGYYRVALTDRERQRLRIRGLELLPAHARRAYAATVAREYQRGAIPFAEALDTLAERAADDTELLGAATDLLLDAKAILGPAFHDKIERHARRLCGTQLARVGRDALANEPRERAVLRREVIRCLTLAGRDRELRLEARQRARTHFERAADAAPTSFGAFEEVAMQVLGEDGEPADFDRLLGLAGGSDSRRERAKTALAFAQDATLVDGLQAPPRTEDRVAILHQRFAVAHLAGANWDWLASNDGAVLRELMAWEGWPLRVVERLCDARRLAQAEASLPPLGRTPKQSETIQAALAQARACAGPRASHEAEMRAYFTTR
ncbi:MAG: ERAP1-like C-terminal domain-containing protein [Myxococcales bacterium]|nr:ERAP1-like C-terminal domain-containing protein [Myxococcales bacterium]